MTELFEKKLCNLFAVEITNKCSDSFEFLIYKYLKNGSYLEKLRG